jgi:hypothetical protein
MKNNIQTIIVVGVVIAIGVGLYFTQNQVNTSTIQTPVVTTSSAVGCYVAHLQKDTYTLIIDTDAGGSVTGRIAYNNYEKDSSSGTFVGTFTGGVLLGTYSFQSEGMDSSIQYIFKHTGDDFIQGFGPIETIGNKEVLVNKENFTTYDPKMTFKKSASCTQTFTDTNDTYTLTYNSFFNTYEGQSTLGTDWMHDATQKGTLLATVSTGKAFMPSTNFSSVKLTIGSSTDAKAIKSCGTSAVNGEVASGTRQISGYVFNKFMLGDAGAGNRYDTTSYRGVVGGKCYAIEYLVHYTSIGNYSPDQGITEFNQSKITAEMEKIVDSIKFGN